MIIKKYSRLWFFIERIRMGMRAEKIRKQREKEAKILMPRKDETVVDAYAVLDKHLRTASVAQVGDFLPPEEITASWFGDVRVGTEGEYWPHWVNPETGQTVYLTPLAQINLTEVPYVPDKLKKFKLITVFIDAEELPFETPNGEGWAVRAYESLDNLVSLPRPGVKFEIVAMPMKWKLQEKEGPSWEAACHITDLHEFNIVTDSEYDDRYYNSKGTKIGGHPHLIQGPLEFMDDFMFQIDSEEKAGWMWGDCGIGYFGLDDNGQWLFEWTCC